MTGNAQKKVLVIEDDQDTRELTCKMLEGLGHEPSAFARPEDALEKLNSGTFDVVLLDIMMPGMDGYAVLNKIRENPKFQSLPVVMVTAKDGDSEILEGYTSGADYYITKPFTTKQLEYGIKIVTE